jgi:hypothetical protein
VIGLLAFFIVFDVLKDVTEGFGGSIFVAIGAVWGLRKLWISTQARYQGPASTPQAELP